MKGENNMDIVVVEFEGTPDRRYHFNTNLKLMKNGIYDIIADDVTTYNNRVRIVDICPSQRNHRLRTITKAKLLESPPKPRKPYKKIFVNFEKETVCVVWNDGTRTVMKPQFDDEFDMEKGIAMCFMKKVYQNRGCFNDVFRDVEIM